jgi:hypothetical protein
MANHNVENFVDDELSVPGHTALVAHNHNTGVQSLSCDDCVTHLGRFEPERWREKHIRETWRKHLASQEVPARRGGDGTTTFGPYDTEDQAAAEPLTAAWQSLPRSGNPGGDARDLKLSHLREACADAGVELGRYDTRILAWLATYEPTTVQVVIGVISRAHAAGQDSLGSMQIIEHEGRGLKVITLALHDRLCPVRVASPQEGTSPEVLHCHFCGFCYPRLHQGGEQRG